MTRILEFQPTDEQTIVARVLVELHQAIDVSFPNAKPSARQFSRTILTNQGESTRIDNAPHSNDERAAQNSPVADDLYKSNQGKSQISMTPRTGARNAALDHPLHTAQLRTLLGESHFSRLVRKVLIGLLLIGIALLIWLAVFGPSWPSDLF